MSVSVPLVSEIIVRSLLYYSWKVQRLLETEEPQYVSTTNLSQISVYIGEVVLDIYMKLSTGSVTLTSQDNLSDKQEAMTGQCCRETFSSGC